MNYLILAKSAKDEFCYQALDYYRLFEGFLEPDLAENTSEYIKEPRVMSLAMARNMTVLAFRPLTSGEVRSIHDDNKVVYFSDGTLHPSVAITGHIYDCFVAFGHRSAYKIANLLKIMSINRPVYRIMPWVDVEGIKQYEKPPLGKVSGGSDLALRPMMRLMAAGAVAVVPNRSPFTDVILNGWNGIVHLEDEPDFLQIGEGIKEGAMEIVARSTEFVKVATNKESYIASFNNIIEGGAHDHNEPWIDVNYGKGHEWITPKETMKEGELHMVPASYDDRFRVMKPLSLMQLLNNFSSLRFKRAYIFDSLISEIAPEDIGIINRLLNILGERSKDIVFCFDPPEEWKEVAESLAFLPVAEAVKRVL